MYEVQIVNINPSHYCMKHYLLQIRFRHTQAIQDKANFN